MLVINTKLIKDRSSNLDVTVFVFLIWLNKPVYATMKLPKPIK